MIGFLASLLIARRPGLTAQYARTLVKTGLSVALALIVGIAFVVWLNGRESEAEERGASSQRETDLRTTLERTETGNAARNRVESEAARGGGDTVYEQCVLANRGAAENCKRFLPQ